MSALTNTQNNPHRDFYEVPDTDSTTIKIALIVATFIVVGGLSLLLITLSSNILVKISAGARLPIGIVALPYGCILLTALFYRTLYSFTPSVRESNDFYNHITEKQIENLKKWLTLEDVRDLLIGPKGCCMANERRSLLRSPPILPHQRNVNLGEHVRNGKLTPENVKFLDRMVREYEILIQYMEGGSSDDPDITRVWEKQKNKSMPELLQDLEKVWQKERSTWK